jgi:hypothetical protein
VAIPGPDSPPRSRRLDPRVVGLFTALAVLAATAVAIALTRRDGSDHARVASRSTTSTSSTATTASQPSSTSTAPAAALPPAQAKLIDEIRAQVAELRGLQWKTPLDVAIVPRNEFQQELKRVNDRDRHTDRQTGDGETYKLLKLIPRSLNYDKALEDLYGSAVVGFYDPKTKKLLIGAKDGGALDPAARLTIAHEMDHALTDQHFNFGDRTNALDIGDKQEELQGFIGLLEGDAKVMESLWSTKYLTAKERQTLTSSGDLTDFYRSPKYLRDSLLYPYTSGQAWAMRLYQQTRSWRLIDAAYADPPRSTEDVLHLDRYQAKPRRGWSPPQLPPLTAGTGCAAVRSGTIGEFNMIELLDQNLTLNDAAVSADGWNGDAFQVVKCAAALAMVDRWEADDATAAGRLAEALGRWAREWSGGAPPGADGRFSGSSGSGRIVRNGTRVDLVLADDAPSADKVAAAAGVA